MTYTNYKKGYALELRCKKFLEKNRYQVMRAALSKGSYDLLAVNDFNKLFIQCKKTGSDKMYLKDLKQVMRDAETVNGIPVLVYAFNRTPMYARVIKQNSYALGMKKANMTFDDFLGMI
jgi:Holliday junction resolvase